MCINPNQMRAPKNIECENCEARYKSIFCDLKSEHLAVINEHKGCNIYKKGQTIFSEEYATALHVSLKGMVEEQMRASVQACSDFWFTAWVNAGKPDLSALDPAALTKRNTKQFKQEYKLWKQGKLFGVESEKEF